jgi:DNA (cytosine-5)-methyltransferase 1
MSIDAHFKLLDLYCGDGLASWGYWRSGCFSSITGVDIDPDMSSGYSFDFVLADAIRLDYEFLMQFDFIHASPPCQAYSKMTPKAHREKHMRLIAATHLMLHALGRPYVIENVEGSGVELRPNVVLDGGAFGLGIKRRRYFYVSLVTEPVRKLMSNLASYHPHGKQMRREEIIQAFGLAEYVSEQRLSRLTVRGIEQGIPPVFTHWIAQMVVGRKFMIG